MDQRRRRVRRRRIESGTPGRAGADDVPAEPRRRARGPRSRERQRACVVNGRLDQDRADLGGRWPDDPLRRRRTGRRRSQRRVFDGRLVGPRTPHRAARLQIQRARRSQRTRARLHDRGSITDSTARRTRGSAGRTRRRWSWRRRGRRGRWRSGRRPESVRRRRARRRRRNPHIRGRRSGREDDAHDRRSGRDDVGGRQHDRLAQSRRRQLRADDEPGAQRRTDHGAHRLSAGQPGALA